jgi:hypothetical protein
MWLLSFVPDWIFYGLALASFVALILATFLKVIPFIGKYAIPIQLLSFVVLLVSVFLCGGLANEASWQLKVAKTNAEIAELKVKSEKVSTKVVTKYIDRIQVVKEKGNEIVKYINKESIVIHQNKFMDFFYMKDLISLIDYYITNNNLPKEIDCSYSSLYKLSDIANIINDLDDHKVNIQIENEGIALPYYGLANVLMEYIGLKQGIKETYNKLKNEY